MVGDKGVGKTFTMDVAARMLTGADEEQKINQMIDEHCSAILLFLPSQRWWRIIIYYVR